MKTAPNDTAQTALRPLYTAEQSRWMDQLLIEKTPVAGVELMRRAARACFGHLIARWPGARDIVIVAGRGNNGGDGCMLGQLLLAAGRRVRVVQAGGDVRPGGDAARALEEYRAAGGVVAEVGRVPDGDLIVDAIFGSGLNKALSAAMAELIEDINRRGVPVLAVDVPSGLDADTGAPLPVAVRADRTVSFIARKRGLYTSAGTEYGGEVVFSGLQTDPALAAEVPPCAHLAAWREVRRWLPARRGDTHKGQFGHLLVVGGNAGMMGAALLAGEAAMRAGAGLVSVATREAHAAAMAAACPVLMPRGVEEPRALRGLIEKVDVIVAGPGLGRDEWARAMLDAVIEAQRPAVVDADALRLLAAEPAVSAHWVLTPHPGEAAALLGVAARDVQADRFAAAQSLQRKYGGVCVLKGAGTVVCSPAATVVCEGGHAGMSSAGMGDVLSGVIAALLGQGLAPEQAAVLGVCAHAEAGERAGGATPRGLIATDLLLRIREAVNS